jgi:hypothetical protein
VPFADAEAFRQGLLHIDEIADADDRKIHSIGLAGVGIRAGRAGGGDAGNAGVEIDQRVRRDDEIPVGVDGLARPDQAIPIARRLVLGLVFAEGVAVAGEEMRDEDGVGAVGVQRSGGLPTDLDALDRLAAERRQRRHLEDLFLDDERRGSLGHGWRQENHGGGRGGQNGPEH